MEITTDTQYQNAVRMMQANETARREWCTADGQNVKGWTSVTVKVSESLPFAAEVTNELRSAVEVWEFNRDTPSKYFLYINEKTNLATTWTGDKLGSVIFGNAYRSNFGDKRIPVTIHAVNGRKYHGTYYTDAGSYARITLSK